MRISDWSSDVCSSDLTTLARGWAPRRLGDTAPVDAQTLFQTGSTGKAMTAAALALLVDQGKLGWADPVINHLPWCRMSDPGGQPELPPRDPLHPGTGQPDERRVRKERVRSGT